MLFFSFLFFLFSSLLLLLLLLLWVIQAPAPPILSLPSHLDICSYSFRWIRLFISCFIVSTSLQLLQDTISVFILCSTSHKAYLCAKYNNLYINSCQNSVLNRHQSLGKYLESFVEEFETRNRPFRYNSRRLGRGHLCPCTVVPMRVCVRASSVRCGNRFLLDEKRFERHVSFGFSPDLADSLVKNVFDILVIPCRRDFVVGAGVLRCQSTSVQFADLPV